MHPTDPQHANPQFNPYFQVSRSFLKSVILTVIKAPPGPMVPGLPPFGGPHCRPRIPLQPAGQPIFPHGSIDQVIRLL